MKVKVGGRRKQEAARAGSCDVGRSLMVLVSWAPRICVSPFVLKLTSLSWMAPWTSTGPSPSHHTGGTLVHRQDACSGHQLEGGRPWVPELWTLPHRALPQSLLLPLAGWSWQVHPFIPWINLRLQGSKAADPGPSTSQPAGGWKSGMEGETTSFAGRDWAVGHIISSRFPWTRISPVTNSGCQKVWEIQSLLGRSGRQLYLWEHLSPPGNT
ncbi:uncharacterized protein LOC100937227 [Pongo abelii]|uniref:uncharacterized protein LOC100937227 n=1 Tax=Pongo abelii TaxID=9601 RepID=UPI0023E8E5CA|nr:uncharacterized protein LOC100937227 [Pongo abelii]XP_054405946.1 uncharacterized protein LOC100937227 [Pongo abelii]XP_054405947.1 uncharacterized protein LOC100937227 [Pongo abelii]